ncbi:2-acyl-glycerophospho-ethanolamine acyltransferase [Arthrobacter saudimassiliensis]|uniref:2-acyl-glycerophospho-ethanolamine acyltransferase n=1 Tax=Arthrobacter saudimassiliensis TaxID=1461584 RepID=A0A078MUH2_9MICC|nr:2-acyl-glycerophospho-ethanolamine acyltransferase [Arthrobacter saudimassiliensis]
MSNETTKSRLVFALVAGAVRPVMNALMARDWRGMDKLPRDTGFIVCPNHVTEIDPLVVGHYLYNQKIMPRYLAKESLFRVPVLGAALRGTRQVPVARSTGKAGASLEVARDVIDAGGALIIYPEGTLTRDPDLWPMRGRTGAARLALETGAPVVPMAHWGAQDVLPRYGRKIHAFPRKRVTVLAGDPVDLSDLRGQPLTRETVDEATHRIMDAVTALVAQLRGEQPPAERWDPAAHGQPETGRSTS